MPRVAHPPFTAVKEGCALCHKIFVTRDWNECRPSMTQHGFGQQLIAEGDVGIAGEPLAITGLHQ